MVLGRSSGEGGKEEAILRVRGISEAVVISVIKFFGHVHKNGSQRLRGFSVHSEKTPAYYCYMLSLNLDDGDELYILKGKYTVLVRIRGSLDHTYTRNGIGNHELDANYPCVPYEWHT